MSGVKAKRGGITMYEIGQKINIGYYGGFHNQTLIKAQAELSGIRETDIEE